MPRGLARLGQQLAIDVLAPIVTMLAAREAALATPQMPPRPIRRVSRNA